MADARIVLPGGATVHITGSADEVSAILNRIASDSRSPAGEAAPAKKRPRGRSRGSSRSHQRSDGPSSILRVLKDEGFFRGQKRQLQDVVAELASRGHILPRTTVAPLLLRATKGRDLRRLKENGHWVYTSSD